MVSYKRPSTLTRLQPSRSISMYSGNAGPTEFSGSALPKLVLPMALSSGLQRRLCERLRRNRSWPHRPAVAPSQALSTILRGGSLMSSREDGEQRRTTHLLRSPGAEPRRQPSPDDHRDDRTGQIIRIDQQLRDVDEIVKNARNHSRLYQRQPQGIWRRAERFREIARDFRQRSAAWQARAKFHP